MRLMLFVIPVDMSCALDIGGFVFSADGESIWKSDIERFFSADVVMNATVLCAESFLPDMPSFCLS